MGVCFGDCESISSTILNPSCGSVIDFANDPNSIIQPWCSDLAASPKQQFILSKPCAALSTKAVELKPRQSDEVLTSFIEDCE